MEDDKIIEALSMGLDEKEKEIEERIQKIERLIEEVESSGVDMSKYKSILQG